MKLLEKDNRMVVMETTTRTETNDTEIYARETSRCVIPVSKKVAEEVQPRPPVLG